MARQEVMKRIAYTLSLLFWIILKTCINGNVNV